MTCQYRELDPRLYAEDSGIARGQTLQVAMGILFRCPKKFFWREINACLDTDLSKIDLSNADTGKGKFLFE